MAQPRYLRALCTILFIACATLGAIALLQRPASAQTTTDQPAGDMYHLFRGDCDYSHSNTGDPIMLPSSSEAHMHDFLGNDTTDQNSTVDSLQKDSPYLLSKPSRLQCDRMASKSSYWVPRIQWGGKDVKPKRTGAYYATRTGLPPEGTTTTPFGFKAVAFSKAAVDAGTKPSGSEAKLYWHCNKQMSAQDSIRYGTPDPPTSCPVDPKFGYPTLGVTVLFPQCWDKGEFNVQGGAKLRHAEKDSTTGKLSCPTGFSTYVPQLALFVDYNLPSQTGPLKVLGSGGMAMDPKNYHADYFNSEQLESLVDMCIRKGQGNTTACGANRNGGGEG